MKRIVFTVIAALFSIVASSQEHMKFKGFDIDGSTEEFANKLTTVGFTIINTNEKQVYGLKGEFAGYEATVVAYPNSKGITYGIAVLYDLKDIAWKVIEARYDNLEKNLTAKYGQPYKSVRKMKYPYNNGSGNEILGFKLGKNDYGASWLVEGVGEIVLTFQPSAIILLYNDMLNSMDDKIQAFDDL